MLRETYREISTGGRGSFSVSFPLSLPLVTLGLEQLRTAYDTTETRASAIGAGCYLRTRIVSSNLLALSLAANATRVHTEFPISQRKEACGPVS